jgi:hypothetical protein
MDTQETIVSSSEKGSMSIQLVERIPREQNELLFDAVETLTKISQSADFDTGIFRAMDKVCQMLYDKWKGS